MADAIPDTICINYDLCGRGISSDFPRASIQVEEVEEVEMLPEKQKSSPGLMSSDAPYVKGNRTHAIAVLAEDETLYGRMVALSSDEGFTFR